MLRMEKNKNILAKLKKNRNPFLVPDNYFEDFSKKIMENLPADENDNIIHLDSHRCSLRLKIISVAACFLLILGGAGIFFHSSSGNNSKLPESASSKAVKLSSRDKYIEQATDYAMMDNQDIYACLSDE